MNIDRARVLAIIKDIRDVVRADRACGIVPIVDLRGCEVVRRVCAEHAMSVDEWLAVLRIEVELGRLLEKALDELIGDPPDPGPYDEISRESPTGLPGSHDGFERDQRLLDRRSR